MIYNKQKYEPFIITQIREMQNEFIMSSKYLSSYKQEFSDILYKYIDNMPPRSCLRLFRYRNRVYLTYFWLSDMVEPKSGREGIYLITGVSCSYNKFKQNPIYLSHVFIEFLSVIAKTFGMDEIKYSSTDIIKELWQLNDINVCMRDIYDEWRHLLLDINTNSLGNIAHRFSLPRRCSDVLYILSDLSFDKYVHVFVASIAINSNMFQYKFDYSDTKGYGHKCIKVLFSGDPIRHKINKLRLRYTNIYNETILFIELLYQQVTVTRILLHMLRLFRNEH